MEEILSIDPSGFVMYFWFLVLLGLALGAVVYLLLRRPGARRPQFRSPRGVSGRASLLVALLVAVPIVWYAYAASWGHFYSVEMGDQSLVLGYHYPTRTVRIPRSEEITFSRRASVRKSGIQYRLVLRDARHRVFTSQLMPPEESKAALSRLRAVLAVGGK